MRLRRSPDAVNKPCYSKPGTNQTWQLRLAMSAHRGTSGNPHGGRASRVAYAILDDIDLDQCTNEWLLEPEKSGKVDPQKSLWSEDHAHL